MDILDAEKNFASLVDRVHREGITIDLDRDDKVIARITPVLPHSPMTLGELRDLIRSRAILGDDAEDFANDLRAIRKEFPAEPCLWD